MRKPENTYITVKGIKFVIKTKYGRFHIAFSHNGIRVSRSTKLKATKQNLRVVKTEVIPQVAEELVVKSQSTNSIVNSDDTILDNFAEKHLDIHQNNVRDHVYKRDLSNFLRHILPYFKGRKLSSIKPIELEAWQNRLMRKYKAGTVQKYRSIFYSIFTRAVNNDLLDKNPLDRVTAPKVKKVFNSFEEDSNVNPFTKAEIDTLVNDESDTSYMRSIILFLSQTGIRPGEAIALKWSDIDFDTRRINVDKTVINGKVGLPKTRSSVRVVDMLDGAFKALQIQYQKNKHKNSEHVFTNQYSKPFRSHDIININLKKRLKHHNIEVRSLYQLRHHFASHMIQNGVDITWVSRMLGHIDSAITLKVYTKYIQEDEQTRMKNLEKINKQLVSC